MIRRASPLLLVLGLALALLAAGCGQRDEPTGELTVPYPVTAQGAGDTATELAAAAERIVALDPGAAELIDALGAGDRLVGVPAGVELTGAAPPQEVVKATGQIDVDAVVGLDPDLVVATPDLDRVDVSRVEQRTGAPVYIQPSRTVEDVWRAVIELGFLVGRPVEARQLVGALKESVAETERRLAAVEPVTTFVDRGFFITFPDRSLLGDLLRRARATNVAGVEAGLGPFPIADLRTEDPDVYLATSDSGVTLESLQRDPKTRGLTAVREGRVVILPAELVTRAGPNVARALEQVALALHPDAFR